jgi:RNA polymerase sigma-70 factor, ECF subfamily
VLAQIPEAELLTRCLKGEADAWDELFARHYAAAGRFVFQLGYDFTREDVEEICQEAFLTVIKHLNTFQRNCQFQTWLFRIAANKARDYREKQNAAKRGGGQAPLPLHPQDADDGLAIDPPSTAPAPDLTLLNAEQIYLVGRALEQIGVPCREVIELRYFTDLSYQEIAAALNLNGKTVSSRLSKCLDKLGTIVAGLFSAETREKTSAGPV